MNVAPINGKPAGVEFATPAQLAAFAKVVAGGRKLQWALLSYECEPGGEVQVPVYRIRQESVRRREGRYDRTEVSTWRVWFGFVEILLPESVATEFLIYLIRKQGGEFAADALTEAIRKSMPGAGDGSAEAAREIVHGREGRGDEADTVRGRVGDVNERDVAWDKVQIAKCVRGMDELRQEIREHEDAGDVDSDACRRWKAKLEEQQDLLAACARKVKGRWVPKVYQKGTFGEKADVIGKHFRKLLGGYLRRNCRPLFDHLNDKEVLRYGVKNCYRPNPRINWEIQLQGIKNGT